MPEERGARALVGWCFPMGCDLLEAATGCSCQRLLIALVFVHVLSDVLRRSHPEKEDTKCLSEGEGEGAPLHLRS